MVKRQVGQVTIVAVCIMVFWGIFYVASAKASKTMFMPADYELAQINYTAEQRLAPTKFNGNVRKIVYLTIDDGPSLYSSQLISILEHYNVPVTHFLIGKNIEKYPESVKQYEERGDYIGLHSMTHDYNTLYKKGEAINEMLQVQDLLKSSLSIESTLFRCPFGSMPGLSKQLRDEAVAAGLRTWDWTIDSNDWKLQNRPSQIVKTIEKQLNRQTEVILIHEKKGTIDVLPQIIELLIDEGYEFATYDESKHFTMNFYNDDRL